MCTQCIFFSFFLILQWVLFLMKIITLSDHKRISLFVEYLILVQKISRLTCCLTIGSGSWVISRTLFQKSVRSCFTLHGHISRSARRLTSVKKRIHDEQVDNNWTWLSWWSLKNKRSILCKTYKQSLLQKKNFLRIAYYTIKITFSLCRPLKLKSKSIIDSKNGKNFGK